MDVTLDTDLADDGLPPGGVKCPACGAEDWRRGLVRELECGSCEQTYDTRTTAP